MKKYIVGFLLITNFAWAQTTPLPPVEEHPKGISFKHDAWETIKTMAQKEHKGIFVDCYTTWCGPCKMLSRYVFTNDTVGAFFNTNYIN